MTRQGLTGLFIQSDSTRAKQQELLIQSRVTAELEKLLASSSKSLSSLSESISQEPSAPSATKSGPSLTEKPLVDRIAEKLRGRSSESQSVSEPQANLDRNSVQKEIDGLKKKLDARKTITQLDADVEKAKEDVVSCLKKNDRRPLDCWQEVQNFKTEVGRLEKAFVEKNGR